MISTDDQDKPRGETPPGVVVEYYDSSSATWMKLENLKECEPRIMDGELAIYFAGSDVPWSLLGLGYDIEAGTYDFSAIQLRVTGTIESDVAIEETVSDGDPVVGSTIEEIYDRASEFQFREVSSGSIFYGSSGSTRQSDPSVLAAQRADSLLSLRQTALLNGRITLEGCDRLTNNVLGEQISEIEGREIGLVTHPSEQRYPLCVEIAWEPQNQQISLILEMVRPHFTRPRLTEIRGIRRGKRMR
jgi:hypothetical protein